MLSVPPPHIVTDGGAFAYGLATGRRTPKTSATSVGDAHHIGTDGRRRCLIIARSYKELKPNGFYGVLPPHIIRWMKSLRTDF